MRGWGRIVTLGCMATLLLVGNQVQVAAQEGDSPEFELAEKYAPVVFVKPQDAPCDTNGEPFEPAPVEIVLDNREVFLRQVGNGDAVAMLGPGGSDLFDLREGWYLDFPGDALEPGCIFEQDFRRFYDGRSVVYAHVVSEPDRPGFVALQYWFFWYHNPAKNDHEGDWEFIQLLFEADTVTDALAVEPAVVGYAQHTGGERADWDDPKLHKVGVRPVVYPAKGSHASYFDQALYLGRSGHEGFGCDNTDGAMRRLDPAVVLLPDDVTDSSDRFAWLTFRGRWGQREAGFLNGPTGPMAKARWTEPVAWHDNLRDSSVVVPGGDRQGAAVVNAFCRAVEVGSSALVFGLRSPVTALVIGATALILSAALASRTRWAPVVTSPLRRQRAMGQIIRAAVRVWRDHPLAMSWVGLVYLPVAFITSMIQAGIQQLPLVDHLLDLVGDHSVIALLFAVFVGGLGNLLAFVYVSAVVASTIDGGGWEHGRPMLDWATLGPLLGAVVRAAVIVVALLISIVGSPWAFRQLIRYQMVPQVVALDRVGAGEALRRSSTLVRGSWWWTAGVIALAQVTIATAGIAAALVLLVTATSIPLWLFSVLSAVIFVVLVPVGAAAMAYVYGTLATRPTEKGDGDDGSESALRTQDAVVA
jgi:hypothetical protein